jgi:hypothetical protein
VTLVHALLLIFCALAHIFITDRETPGQPASRHGQPAGKMGGAMWLWALGQQTERIKSRFPPLAPHRRVRDSDRSPIWV